jgi:hypothetical protein
MRDRHAVRKDVLLMLAADTMTCSECPLWPQVQGTSAISIKSHLGVSRSVASSENARGDPLTSRAEKDGRVFTRKGKVYVSPLVERTSLDVPERRAMVFQLEVPADALEPGLYTCQVNVIDVVAGQLTCPRMLLYIRKSSRGRWASEFDQCRWRHRKMRCAK